MKPYKNENSSKKRVSIQNQISSRNLSLLYLKFFHKIFDSLNISLLFLIFILSFLSLNSQRKWTNIYSDLAKTKLFNNNLIDYISNTEELYIQEFESLNTLKKTTPEDLIYFERQVPNKKDNFFIKNIKNIHHGLKDSIYQRGY